MRSYANFGARVVLEVPDLGLRMDVAMGFLSPMTESRSSSR